MYNIKHLKNTQGTTNAKAREDTRRKPATRASRIQKRVFNDRTHPRREPTKRELQRI